MSKTRAEIQFKALAILTGGDVGADPSAEDAVAIDGYIDSEAAEINTDGTTYISDVDALNEELFIPFSKLVANAAADEFGGKSNDQLAMQLRNRIRVLARQTPGYGPQEVTYF
jgi:hypothetical protein